MSPMNGALQHGLSAPWMDMEIRIQTFPGLAWCILFPKIFT
jgi:hypothetical protein